MDDPTKDTIPRSAVEYCLRKETVSTNPEAYKAHEKFIGYMDDPEISQFGHWMHANGYNCALTSVAVDLDKIPSVQPEREKGRWIDIDAETYTWKIRCDQCGHERSMLSTGQTYPRFCENCGADMRGDDND